MDHDRKFFDTFMLVLGGLVAIAVVIYFIASDIGEKAEMTNVASNQARQELVEQRIAPVADVRTQGQPEVQTASASSSSTASANGGSGSSGGAMSGEQVYQSTCVACHGMGIAGAPKFGDKQSWAPHVAKGLDTLEKHAINGFNGPNGMMPAKGGNASLSDEEVKAAVKYMVDNSK
jgi:cytochrome c5